MCDCYVGKCEKCGREMNMHIGDYSTEQENVHPYCPKCLKYTGMNQKLIAMLNEELGRADEENTYVRRNKLAKKLSDKLGRYVFIDEITGHNIVDGLTEGMVIIFCDDPKGTNIHLN